MSKIVSIHSFRGGTGKSNITANLAVTVALQGHRVAIVDTDIQSPGIHVLFGMDVEKIDRTLNDYLWGNCSIEETALEVSSSLVLPNGKHALDKGIAYLIPSSNNAGEIARILREGYDVGLLNDGLNELINRLSLDFLFIDTHPGLNEETLLSMAISDILIIILRPDNQDYQGTAVTVEVARKLAVSNMFLVMNKVLPDFDFEDVKRQMQSTYDTQVAGLLPISMDMLRLASSGIFCLREPEHDISKEIRNISKVITTTE